MKSHRPCWVYVSWLNQLSPELVLVSESQPWQGEVGVTMRLTSLETIL